MHYFLIQEDYDISLRNESALERVTLSVTEAPDKILLAIALSPVSIIATMLHVHSFTNQSRYTISAINTVLK
jgi:hypothetical protein